MMNTMTKLTQRGRNAEQGFGQANDADYQDDTEYSEEN